MKKWIYILLFVTVPIAGFCQQTETYTQYIYNQFALNPAVTGTGECTDIKFGTRLQWVGFEGAPMTNFISIHKGFKFIKGNGVLNSWHGIGLYVVDDRTGNHNGRRVYQRTAIYPAYAFHLRLAKKTIASFGVFVGVKNQKFGGIVDSQDPVIGSPSTVLIFPDIGAGVLLYSENFFFGLSAKQIYKNDMSGFGGQRIGSSTRANMQYYATLGRKIKPSGLSFGYTPSAHIKFKPFVPPSVDVSLMFHYFEDKFNLGGSYRFGDGLAAMLQFQLIKRLSVGYAYEYPLSKIRIGSTQTHEIMFKWDPCWTQKEAYGGVSCPVF